MTKTRIRRRLFCAAAALALLALGSCNEKIVNTTSIALRVYLADAGFKPSFVESVEIYLRSADTTRPIEPPETAATPVTFSGVNLEFEVKDFDSPADGKRETRLKILGNPFAAKTDGGAPELNLTFESKSAARNPLKIEVRALKGTRVIASGSATKNIEGNDIVTVDGERKQVEVPVRCAADFACDTGNQAPVITAIGDQTVIENETKEVQAAASDMDGHAVKWSLEFPSGSKAGEFISISEADGKLLLKPGFAHAGTYTGVTVVATDQGTPPRSAREIITVFVTNTNRNPVFTRVGGKDVSAVAAERTPLAFSVRENETVLIRLEATDADPTGNTLVYSIKNLAEVPATAQLNAQTGQFSWTPDAGLLPNGTTSQDFPITFVVSDSEEGSPATTRSDEVSVVITVSNVNRAPVFTSATPLGNQTIAEGQTLTLSIAATDPDGDALSYTAEWLGAAPPSIPTAATAVNSSNGTFLWTFGFGDQNANPYQLRLTVSDGFGGSLSQTIGITVNNVNRAPTLTAFESTTGTARCTQSGTTITACSPFENETLSVTVDVSDDSEDTITSLTVSPSNLTGATFVVEPSKKRGVFTWTASYAAGSATPVSITFTASDAASQGTLVIPVTVQDVNRAPVITLTENAVGGAQCSGSDPVQCVINEDDALSFAVTVSDDAGESITALTGALTSTSEPAGPYGLSGQSSDNTTATFTFEPTHADAIGSAETTYTFEIAATDSKGTSSTRTVRVTVANTNRTPTMAFVPTTAGQCPSGDGTVTSPLLCTINEGETLGLTVDITESDADDRINLLTMSAPTATGAAFSPNARNTSGTFSWTPTFTQGDRVAGASPTYTITFSGQDSKGASVQGAVTVTVDNKNRPPQISLTQGTVGSTIVCKNDPSPPADPSTGEQMRSAKCFLEWSATKPETLVAKLSVTDPDGDDTVDVTYESENLPQLGPAYDSVQKIFSFTPQSQPAPNTGDTYTVRFRATDRDTVAPRVGELELTIYVGTPNQAPTLSLEGCLDTISAGSAIVCTVRIDDPNPRDTNLSIEATFLNGASFSYNSVLRLGTFIFVTALSDWGTYQVDFTAKDTEGATSTVHYNFHVQRRDMAIPKAFPIIASQVLDMDYAAPFLYTVNGGFLSSFNIVGANTINSPRHTLVPSGAEKVSVDAANSRVYVLGEALKIYSVSAQGEPVGGPVKYNLPDGPAAEMMVVRPNAAEGVSYVYVGFPSLSTIDVIRVSTCQTELGTILCPQRVRQLREMSGYSRFDKLGELLVATGTTKMTFFRMNDDSLNEIGTITPSGYVFGIGGSIGRPTFDLRSGDTSLVITVPASATDRTWDGFAVLTVAYPDITSPTQVTRTAGTVAAMARISAGASGQLLVAAGPNDVRRFNEAGTLQGSLNLAGDLYTDVFSPAGSNLAFAISQPPNLTLSAIDVTNPTAPVRGAERSFAATAAGAPTTYQNTSPAANVLYIPRGETGIEVFDLSSASSPGAAVNILTPTGAKYDRTATLGTNLIAWEESSISVGKKHLNVFDLSTNAINPTTRTAVGFEIGGSPYNILPFKGAAGQLYFYAIGVVCKPTCAAGGPLPGVWLVEITSAGLELRNNTNTSGVPQTVDLGSDILNGRTAIAVNGTALYRTSINGPQRVIIYDITDPKLPVNTQRDLDTTSIPIGNSPRLYYASNVLMILGSQGSGAAGFVEVSATDPTQLRLAGLVTGLGDTIAGVVQDRSRSFLSSTRLGITRIDTTDIDHPRVSGATEAPNNAVSNIVLHRYAQKRCCDGLTSCASALVCTSDSQCTSGGTCSNLDLLVAAEPNNVTVFELLR